MTDDKRTFLSASDAAAEAVRKGQRVSLADIEAFIAEEHRFVMGEALEKLGHATGAETKRLSVHVLVLANGFTIIGTSAPADPANFDAELGRKLARDDAIRQVWPLMGFALANKVRGI